MLPLLDTVMCLPMLGGGLTRKYSEQEKCEKMQGPVSDIVRILSRSVDVKTGRAGQAWLAHGSAAQIQGTPLIGPGTESFSCGQV